MAKVSFDNILPENNSGNSNGIAFFGLKNGEEAIVRILVNSVEDFDIHTVHNVKLPNYEYGRRVNCLRDPQQPIDACPLCAANVPLMQKIFVHIIQYSADQNGAITPQAKVWERSINDRNFGARALKGYLDNYGPLSEMVCKIIRRGEGLNTEYQFIPNLNPAMYRPEVYVKNESLFDNYSPVGSAILDKNFAECQEFLATGNFPAPNKNVTTDNVNAQVTPRTYNPEPAVAPQPNYAPATPQYNPSVTANGATVSNTEAPAYTAPQYDAAPTFGGPGNFAAPATTPKPWEVSPNGGIEKPRRY